MGPEDLARRLDALAAEDLEEALAAARAGARERVRAVLEDALVERMLRREDPPPSPSPSPPAEEPSPAPPAAAAEEASPAGDAVYLYAVLPAADAGSLPSIPGLGGDVETLVEGDLAAVVSRVPLAEFGDEHLKANLERMEWLERTARTHEEVVAAARDVATVVPMRLCTVFHTDDAVREMLDRERDVLADALARLRGRTEWSVKVLADPARVHEALTAGEGAVEEGESEGRGYLAARRREREAAETADARLRAAVRDVHESLAATAEAALRNPVQRRELSGYTGEMVLNGVYLVDDARAEEFFARVDELADRHADLGLELERTGPWPPYNFVAPPEEP